MGSSDVIEVEVFEQDLYFTGFSLSGPEKKNTFKVLIFFTIHFCPRELLEDTLRWVTKFIFW